MPRYDPWLPITVSSLCGAHSGVYMWDDIKRHSTNSQGMLDDLYVFEHICRMRFYHLDVCNPGTYYVVLDDVASCVPCARGSYTDKTNENVCTMCPLGNTTRYAGSTSEDDCIGM